MRKPNTEHIAKQAALACEKLFKQGDQALNSALDARSPLRARGYDSGPTGKGDVSNTTMDLACARVDRQGPDHYDELVRAINDFEVVSLRVRGLIDRQVRVLTEAEVREMAKARKKGAGLCVACEKSVPGEGEDRIKSGLCPEHYTGSRRSPLTRVDYIDEVRREEKRKKEEDVADNS